MSNVIYSCPAYDIIESRVFSDGAVHIKAGEAYAVNRGYDRPALTYANSVVSYAIENNDDPIAAYARAIEHNHETHWLNLEALSLTSHKRDRRVYRSLDVGQLVRFEGRYFTVENAANFNVKLVPFTEK